MRFIPTVATFFALANFSSAWTQDANGVWTANNNWYWIGGDYVHEACTVMGTERTHTGPCGYFTNNSGHIFRGHCAIVLGHDHTEIHCR
ncbi:hypothetical protein NM208_g6706 [Fusarium decemcellulare]|uniref:Uncharacterized protein n=1 Tax=Fusarium decemcellulare TaxID=57161 RepID=A0ACC1SBZ2_9HYPO|nr:hypothetical protein NM208_g6706 [Fusarium decemcellulare]